MRWVTIQITKSFDVTSGRFWPQISRNCTKKTQCLNTVCMRLRSPPSPSSEAWNMVGTISWMTFEVFLDVENLRVRDTRWEAQMHLQLHFTYCFLAVPIPTSKLIGRDRFDVDESFQWGARRCASVEDGVPGSIGWCRDQRKHTDLGAGCHQQAQWANGWAGDAKKIKQAKDRVSKCFGFQLSKSKTSNQLLLPSSCSCKFDTFD